jgi:Asp-tRNA(Asn)/Glu-tRNA(Gln) amidotransferase A subunit family amidase
MEHSTAGVTEAVEAAAAELEDRGATVERVRVEGFGEAPVALAAVSGAEFATLVGNGGQTYGTGTGYAEPWRAAVVRANEEGAYGENVRDQLLTHGTLTAATGGENYVAAQCARRAFTDRVHDRLESFDALLTPTTPIAAPEFGEIDDDAGLLRTIANTGPFNLTGHPALSVPCGESDGRPVGLQVVADYHDEATAVRVGGAVERTR